MTDPGANVSSSASATFLLDTISKGAVVGAGLLYLLGLLVVNARLAAFGAGSLGLFDVSYASAGVWALVPLLGGATIRLLLGGDIRWSQHPRTPVRWLQNVGIALLLTFFAAAIIGGPLMWFGVRITSGESLVAWIACIWLAVVFTDPTGMDKKPSAVPPSRTERMLTPAFTALIVAGMVGFYTQLFAPAYATIPARWGGGAPVFVHIGTNQALAETLTARYGFDQDSLGIRGRLLLAARDVLVLAPDSAQRAVVVPRSSIELVGLDRGCRTRKPTSCTQ